MAIVPVQHDTNVSNGGQAKTFNVTSPGGADLFMVLSVVYNNAGAGADRVRNEQYAGAGGVFLGDNNNSSIRTRRTHFALPVPGTNAVTWTMDVGASNTPVLFLVDWYTGVDSITPVVGPDTVDDLTGAFSAPLHTALTAAADEIMHLASGVSVSPITWPSGSANTLLLSDITLDASGIVASAITGHGTLPGFDSIGYAGAVNGNWASTAFVMAAAATGDDINLNPIGSDLGDIASGVPGITVGAFTVLPDGSTLGTIASDTPVIDVEQNVDVLVDGSKLQPMDSGILDFGSESDITANPVGNTISALGENNAVDLISDLEITFLEEGSALLTIESGVVIAFTGIAADVNIPPIGSELLEGAVIESGIAIISISNAGNVTINPTSSILSIIQSTDFDDGNEQVVFTIDTDNPSPQTPPGSILSAVVNSGVPILQIIATGVSSTPVGSSLLLITSGIPNVTSSNPTAPPGTAGGRLIIRSITRDIIRPVMRETDIQGSVFNA